MSQLPPAVLPWAVAAGVVAVHVLIACLYAVTLWLSLVAYLLIVDGPWLFALLAAPLLISGGVVALLVLDAALWGARWLWRSRGTWRWCRSDR
jgi:hypothetical protein